MASIKDVAARAGVSIATVSNVLNKTKYVSDELKARVNEAVHALDYQADPVARSMKAGRSKTIGVVTTDMCGLFYPYVMRGIFEEVSKHGYNLITLDTNNLNNQEGSIQRVMDGFAQLVRSRVAGIVFSSIFSEQDEEHYVKRLLEIANTKKRVEIVSVETDFQKYGIDSVYCDSIKGATTATRHLLDVGCTSIGHITGPFYTRVAQDRLTGWRTVLTENGMPCDDRYVAHGDYTHRSGYLGMQALLEREPNLDGMFVSNDQMAIGALRAISEAGRHVPHDMKVIGYDDVFISSALEPSLSTVHVRKKSMGQVAARLLLDRIENAEEQEKAAVTVTLDSRLVVRRTTVADAVEDWIDVDW